MPHKLLATVDLNDGGDLNCRALAVSADATYSATVCTDTKTSLGQIILTSYLSSDPVVVARVTTDIVNVERADLEEDFLIIHTKDNSTGVNTIACFSINLEYDPPVQFIDEVDGFTFRTDLLTIGTFDTIKLNSGDGIRVVFTDSTFGLRAADFFSLNSM
jgi:hypothetical protein